MILVLNSGSSSLKFQLFDTSNLHPLASGIIEQIGEESSQASLKFTDSQGNPQQISQELSIPEHKTAIATMSSLLKESNLLLHLNKLKGIGHRVVHGGETFHQPVLIDKTVMAGIHDLIPLAPLHNPAHLMSMEVTMEQAPHTPQVAVFDTAFHQTIPIHSYLYALPFELYEKEKVRRYGFHGTSHGYVAKEAARFLGRPVTSLKIITLHLGNGASAAAIAHGSCQDTSMGMTPLEGLVMGTRSGDLDPAILFYLARETGMSLNDLDELLNKKSGLKGICGDNDMRSITERIKGGDKQAELALEIFCYRLKKYIGSYLAVLGGADCIVFTGGIGEHSALVRQKSCAGLQELGIIVDPEKNETHSSKARAIHQQQSKIQILIIPTNEELEIAAQTLELISSPTTS
ncbi:MAG: acetate kinase [Bacteroidetes bacterium]|nr:acetate kinase [Pseudomonadota bacterium]MBU1058547.1 acetate kinase [Pseudomonadota bacterium]MBU1800603.1 acetate kinase [Bacteroidota bacterium]